MRQRRVGEIMRMEWFVAVVTALAGAVNGGVLMTLAEPSLMDMSAFWELYVGSCLLGGAVFPILVVRLAKPLSDSVIAFTSASDGLASFMAELVSEFGLASVTAPIGIGVGLVLWVVFGVALIPIVLGAVGAGSMFTFPHVGFGVFVGYAIYGFTLGGFFGLAVQALSKRMVAEEFAAAG